MVGQIFCHWKVSVFGQKWAKTINFPKNYWKYEVFGGKIRNYRHFYPKYDIIPDLKLVFFTPKYFFTLLAVKPGSNLEPCLINDRLLTKFDKNINHTKIMVS